MICEVQGRMQFYVRHMAADAISGLALIGMKRLGVVAGVALRVVEGGIVAARVLVGDVAGGAGELAALKAAALHEA